MSKTIIFVEHGGVNKEFTLKKAKDFGFKIILATTHPQDLIYQYVNKDDVLITDTFDAKKLITDAKNFIESKKIKIDAVITFKESSVIPTSNLAEALNVKGVGSSAAGRSSQNKRVMRETLRDSGFINQPAFRKINIYDKDFLLGIKKFPKPCVIKPLFGSSSHGVKKIENNIKIKQDIKDIRESMKPEDREIFKNFDGEMLLEEYIDGTVISVDGLVADKKIHFIGSTQFIMGKEPYFQQIASFIPPKLDKVTIKECRKLTEEVITILGFDTCGFHCEWRISKAGPMLLEIAARTVGGGILLGYEKVTGIDLINELFMALLGKKVKIDPKNKTCVLHKSVLPDINQNSQLTFFEGFENISKDKDVWHALKFCDTGDLLLVLPETPTQLYYYALKGKTIEYLLEKSRIIESQVLYKTKKVL